MLGWTGIDGFRLAKGWSFTAPKRTPEAGPGPFCEFSRLLADDDGIFWPLD